MERRDFIKLGLGAATAVALPAPEVIKAVVSPAVELNETAYLMSLKSFDLIALNPRRHAILTNITVPGYESEA